MCCQLPRFAGHCCTGGAYHGPVLPAHQPLAGSRLPPGLPRQEVRFPRCWNVPWHACSTQGPAKEMHRSCAQQLLSGLQVPAGLRHINLWHQPAVPHHAIPSGMLPRSLHGAANPLFLFFWEVPVQPALVWKTSRAAQAGISFDEIWAWEVVDTNPMCGIPASPNNVHPVLPALSKHPSLPWQSRGVCSMHADACTQGRVPHPAHRMACLCSLFPGELWLQARVAGHDCTKRRTARSQGLVGKRVPVSGARVVPNRAHSCAGSTGRLCRGCSASGCTSTTRPSPATLLTPATPSPSSGRSTARVSACGLFPVISAHHAPSGGSTATGMHPACMHGEYAAPAAGLHRACSVMGCTHHGHMHRHNRHIL